MLVDPMPVGFMPLRPLARDFGLLDTVCRRCGRHRACATAMLMARHGGYVSIPELKRIVGPGCLSVRAIGRDDACEIHFPQIETPRARAKGGAHTEITAGLPLDRRA